MDETLLPETVHFQGMLSISFPDSGGGTPSSTPLYGAFEEDHHDLRLIYWGDLATTDRVDQMLEEKVGNDSLSLILKDGSWVQLQPAWVGTESRSLMGEEEEVDVMGKSRVPLEMQWDSPCSQGSFRRLVAFSKVSGLLVDGFEDEILGLLEKLELRIKGKTIRQGTKKAKASGSKLERNL